MSDPKADTVNAFRELLHAGDAGRLREVLDPLHAADIAEILDGLENEEKIRLLKYLGNEKAADVLTEVDESSGQALLELLTDGEVVSLLEEMPSDDAADMIASLPKEKSRQVDALLPAEDREKLHELMEFDEDSAGGIMEIERVAVREQATIGDAIQLVRQLADDIENLQNVYVIDREGKLIGTVRILDLLLLEPHIRVADVMEDHVISIPVDMDQEQVAAMFGKYDEFTLPVVDTSNKLVGRITVDDIIDVLEEEASEDIARIAGTIEDEIGQKSPLKIARARLPWLVIAMLGQVLNAFLISRYTVSLETMIVLVFFVPLVIGTAGNTGMQAAVVVVREIALGEVAATQLGKRVVRELLVTFFNGIVLGGILFAVVLVWRGDLGLGLLLVVTIYAVTTVSALVGASVPLFMSRAGIDPAIATGPMMSVSSDILGLLIYMTFATYYISAIAR